MRAFFVDIRKLQFLYHKNARPGKITERTPSPSGWEREKSMIKPTAAEASSMPDCLTITGRTEDGEVMAVQHREYPVYGLQFHPESIMTPDGRTIMEHFLKL